MRILFDIRLTGNHTRRGIGRYVVNLLRCLGSSYPAVQIDLLTDRGQNVDLGFKQIYIDALHEARPHSYDFLFLVQYFPYDWANDSERLNRLLPHAAIRACKRIVGLAFDVIPIVFSGKYLQTTEMKAASKIGYEVAHISSHTFAISEGTRKDFIQHVGVDKNKITTVYGGIDSSVWTPETGSKNKTNDIVYVGGDDFRKNLEGCVLGFARFKQQRPKSPARLIIVCDIQASTKDKLLALARKEKLDISNDILIPGYLSEQELVPLVRNARASIFPSLYEGLGLPILESYSVGTPVFASNISSCSELTLPECQFDPYSSSAIAEAFCRIMDRDDLLVRSCQFGQEVLSWANWTVTTQRIMEGLKKLQTARPILPKKMDRIAVISCLPPQQSGIAVQSAKTFPLLSDRFHLFSEFKNINEFEKCRKYIRSASGDDGVLYHSDTFQDACELYDYTSTIFVIGNSDHHIPTVRMALAKDCRQTRRFLYLHEAGLDGLWFTFLGHDLNRVKELFELWYGPSDLMRTVEFPDFFKCGYLGVWPLIALSGISDIIVNSNQCKKLIERELEGRAKVHIHVAFHPIEKIEVDSVERLCSPEELLVGHFGIPHEAKGIQTLISAVEDIRKLRPARLLLAGWGVNDYLRRYVNIKDQEFILPIDSPSDSRLLGLMASVDVAVQLREVTRGEASGVISQLIGIGKIPITTTGVMDDEFKKWVIEVPKLISSASLAQKILQATKLMNPNNNKESYTQLRAAEKLAWIALQS